MDSAAWISLITSISILVKMFWESREAEKRAVREREWQIADRQQVAAALAVRGDANAAGIALNAAQVSTQIQDALAENTALTSAVGEKADAAYEVANDVNAKIKSLGEHLMKDKK